MTLPRLVLDTNVLVSALVFPAGSTFWLRTAWQSGTIRPLASRETTTELIRVLAYPKFRLHKDERDDLLADYLPWCETVVVRDLSAVPDCRDRHDRAFLALASAGRADARPGDRRWRPSGARPGLPDSHHLSRNAPGALERPRIPAFRDGPRPWRLTRSGCGAGMVAASDRSTSTFEHNPRTLRRLDRLTVGCCMISGLPRAIASG